MSEIVLLFTNIPCSSLLKLHMPMHLLWPERHESFQASIRFLYPISFSHAQAMIQVEDALSVWILSEGEVEHSHSWSVMDM